MILLAAAATDTDPTYVADLLWILATAAFVAIAMQRLRLAVIPAYLVAGALLGPHAFRLVQSDESLSAIAALAVVLLMFGIGLHLQLSILGRQLGRMIAVGVCSCAASVLVGWPVALAFGLSSPAAITACMALSLSSTAVVLRLITDRGELHHATGRLALAILVVQDLLVLAMLAALPLLARWAGAGHGAEAPPAMGSFLADASLRLLGIAALIAFGRLLLPRLLSETARERSGEVMMIASIAVAIGAGVMTRLLGFGMELGAFLAGFLLAATPFRHQLSGQVAPLRNLFMAVFFTTVGMQLDPTALAAGWWVILIGGAVMTALKALIIGATCWTIGATAAMSAAIGLALAQGGEFGLVLLDVAETDGIVSKAVADNAIAIVVISLMLTPGMVNLGRRLGSRASWLRCAPWIERPLRDPAPVTHNAAAGRHVIIGGFGQVGRIIARSLDAAGIGFTIIELNAATVREETDRGRRVIYGDVANADVLESAGLDDADALILTMPDDGAVLAACASARRRRRTIFIAARTELVRQGRTAQELGADFVAVEEIETARAMEDAVMRQLGARGGTPATSGQS